MMVPTAQGIPLSLCSGAGALLSWGDIRRSGNIRNVLTLLCQKRKRPGVWDSYFQAPEGSPLLGGGPRLNQEPEKLPRRHILRPPFHEKDLESSRQHGAPSALGALPCLGAGWGAVRGPV